MQNWLRGAAIALVSVAATLAISQMMRRPVEGRRSYGDHGKSTGAHQTSTRPTPVIGSIHRRTARGSGRVQPRHQR